MAGVTGDMTISTRALRQEVVHVPSPPGFDWERDGMVVSDSDIACYCRPEHGNHILIGSEDPPCDAHVWVEDDLALDRDFTEQWQVQALRFAQRVPSLGIPSRMRGVVDLYDVTDDWIPIYDRSSLPGFYMACGTAGNQYKNARDRRQADGGAGRVLRVRRRPRRAPAAASACHTSTARSTPASIPASARSTGSSSFSVLG